MKGEIGLAIGLIFGALAGGGAGYLFAPTGAEEHVPILDEAEQDQPDERDDSNDENM